jgi:signal transduction histidine kinase/CheY-like chemotaxis protein
MTGATALIADEPATSSAENRPRILLVDDDDRSLVALSEALSDLHAEIVCAASGRDALRQILLHDFAVILLDVRMPELDGYDTAALIRQREKSRRIPLIFLTAVDREEAHVFRGYSAGAVDYVFKPFEPVILRAKVATFIELYEQANEIRRQAEQERRLLEANLRMRSAKREAQHRLRTSEARQSLIIRSLPIALYEAQITGRVVVRRFVHDNVARLLGFEASAFEGDANLWASRVHPDDWRWVLQTIESIPQANEFAVEYRWKCRDGSYRYFLDQGVAANGRHDGAVNVFGTMLDVHDRRLLEQQLAHAQKMDAVGQLTGGIAHDFSNMLTVVIGNLDRLRRAGEIEKPMAEHLDLALQGAMHCRDITKRLMAFARHQALSPQPLDVNDVVDGLADLLKRTLGEGIEIKKKLAKDLWRVCADPTQLESAVVNLVVNSRDAMPLGGRVAIKTANVELAAESPGSPNLPAGPYVLLEVADTGTGMTKDVLARALEPFFTTKEAGRGTGLGLSTIYGFVRQSGGDLVIESEPGKGTAVRIYLPCQGLPLRDVLARRLHAEADSVPRAPNNEVVLAVEDDADVRRTAVGMLRELGYRVIEAERPADALHALQGAEHVDLLFTDVVMPGSMNGCQLATEAQKRKPDLKVLYTSAYSGDRLAEIGAGALRPLLRKPYLVHELARGVHDALARQLGE